MELYKCLPDGNIYNCTKGVKQCVLGVPNVQVEGNLVPLDNSLVLTDHPILKYKVKQSYYEVGYHRKDANKYLMQCKLPASVLSRSIDLVPNCTSVRGHSINYTYNSFCIEESVTENSIQQTIKILKDCSITFQYDTRSLKIRHKEGTSFLDRQGNVLIKVADVCQCDKYGKFIESIYTEWAQAGKGWSQTIKAKKGSYIRNTLLYNTFTDYKTTIDSKEGLYFVLPRDIKKSADILESTVEVTTLSGKKLVVDTKEETSIALKNNRTVKVELNEAIFSGDCSYLSHRPKFSVSYKVRLRRRILTAVWGRGIF